jgi:hypothetical protein
MGGLPITGAGVQNVRDPEIANDFIHEGLYQGKLPAIGQRRLTSARGKMDGIYPEEFSHLIPFPHARTTLTIFWTSIIIPGNRGSSTIWFYNSQRERAD